MLRVNKCKHGQVFAHHCQQCCDEINKANKLREKQQRFYQKFYGKGGQS